MPAGTLRKILPIDCADPVYCTSWHRKNREILLDECLRNDTLEAYQWLSEICPLQKGNLDEKIPSVRTAHRLSRSDASGHYPVDQF
jgi:hypothetical protein